MVLNTGETTENEAVPVPGLMWRCRLTSLHSKEEEEVVHEV